MKHELVFKSNKYGTWTSNTVRGQTFRIEIYGNIYHIFREETDWTGISFRSLADAVNWCREQV